MGDSILPGAVTHQSSWMSKAHAKFGGRRFSAHDQPSLAGPCTLVPSAESAVAAVSRSDHVEVLARSPTSDLVVWPGQLILASALVIIFFELASLLGDAASQPIWAMHLPLRATCLLLGGLLVVVSIQTRLGPRWQLPAFIITSGV